MNIFHENEKEKVFVIINSYLLGDTLLVNPMVQNIKRLWPDSKIVMLINDKLIDAAKYQQGVDEVIIWDRHGKHKGFLNMMKFIKNFPYKNIYAAMPIYGMDRPVMLAYLLGARNVLFQYKRNILKYLKKSKYKIKPFKGKIQEQHLNLLSGITKEEIIDCKMKYDTSKKDEICKKFNLESSNYIAFCPITSRKGKDFPYDTALKLIKSTDAKVVLMGAGATARELSRELAKENLQNLYDLTDKTTILEAAGIMANAKGVISADTGLLHLACAVDVPVLGVFFEKSSGEFAPREDLYRAKSLFEGPDADTILKEFQNLIGKI